MFISFISFVRYTRHEGVFLHVMNMSQLQAIYDLADSNTDRATAKRKMVQTASCAVSGAHMLCCIYAFK